VLQAVGDEGAVARPREQAGADVGDRLAREIVEGVDLVGVARRLVRVRVRGSG